MKTLKYRLLEADGAEAPAANVAPPGEEDKEKVKTSLFKHSINMDKASGVMIFDKILNIIQVLQYDNYNELEEFFDLNENSMVYLEDMAPGETHEDVNSILTKIW